MALNFYQEKDNIIKNLGRKQLDNSILFSTDELNTYGKFSNNFSPFGEHRNLICKDEYTQLSDRIKLDNHQTYYIIDEVSEHNYPIYMTIKNGSLTIITNEAIR